MDPVLEGIGRAVSVHLPGRTVERIVDRGRWERRIVEVTLDGGERVFFKFEANPEGVIGTIKEPQVVALFHRHGLPAPEVLAVDLSGQIIPQPFLIQRAMNGARLGDLLQQVDQTEALAIYEAIGRFYRRLHAIHNDRSGWWEESPDKPFQVSPNEFMYNAEVVGGSGKQALAAGRISEATYNRVAALWAREMGYLRDHQPSLVHGSPFLWTIYLARGEGGWAVSKLMDLSDVLWWDPAYDLAFLRYPPFGEAVPARWAALLRGYGPAPEDKRLLLYALEQRLCAGMGAYKEPQTAHNRAWAARCLADLEPFMDAIEGAG